MVSMALPAVAAQVINVLYNIVDRIYIGHIAGYGELALTGVGVTAPILMVISAFSAFAGMGGAPQASIQLGKKNYEGAEKILGSSVAMLLLFSVVLTIVFQAFKTPILYAFGASDNTIIYARQYITIYLVGTIFVQFALGLNTYISGQGNAKVAMLSVLLGAITNIILDPIFIFGLGMGVRGAALATIISQALSAAWVLRFLTSPKSVIRIRREYIRFDKGIILGIAALGISPFIMQSTESLVMITLNTGLQKYGGDLYAQLFSSNEELTALTCRYMPIYFLGITIFGIQMGCQTTFLALGQAKVSLVIALLRKVVLLIPLAIIFPKFMGVVGIYRAEPTADFTSVAITMILFFITARKVLAEERTGQTQRN